ncbi:MAG: HAD-IA family hydrolase [Elusimicrobiota bacterium]
MKNIVFDFDGVLADSLDTIIEITNRVGGEYGLPRLDRGGVRAMGLTGLMRMSKISTLRLPFFVRKIRLGLAEMMGQVPLHQGMASVVSELARYFNLGILTSNSQDNVNRFLEHHSLRRHFSYLFCGSSLFAKHESAVELIKAKGLDRSESIYVGDEVRDIVAMKKAGLPIMAVSWGFESEELLRPHGPDFFARTPEEFLEIAQGWRAANESAALR